MSDNQGFASLSSAKKKEVSSKGGKRAHQQGVAHKFTSSHAAKAASLKGVEARKKKYALRAAQRLLRAGFSAAQLDRLSLSIDEYIYYGGFKSTKERVAELVERMNSEGIYGHQE